jgi:nucleoside-diphosphate-sugar epimerase
MRVLIIGGTGFIGSHVARLLEASGNDVAVFHRGVSKTDLPAHISLIIGNAELLSKYAPAFRRYAPQVVVHQIAYVEEHARQLLAVFRGVAERTVVLSSGDVYRSYGVFRGTEAGPLEAVPCTEDSPLRRTLYPYRALAKDDGDFLYTYDKIPVERMVQSDAALPATILRLPMVYGPGDRQRRMAGYLKEMEGGAADIVLNAELARWRATRGYVEDVAAAIALAVTDERSAGRIYNVGESEALAEADWVAKIATAASWHGNISASPKVPVPMPGNYQQDLITDTSRIRAQLGYREATSRALALQRSVLWEIEQLRT